MTTPSATSADERQRAAYLAMAEEYRAKAKQTPHLDLKERYIRLATGYEALAGSHETGSLWDYGAG